MFVPSVYFMLPLLSVTCFFIASLVPVHRSVNVRWRHWCYPLIKWTTMNAPPTWQAQTWGAQCTSIYGAQKYMMHKSAWCTRVHDAQEYMMHRGTWCTRVHDAQGYMMHTSTWCTRVHDAQECMMNILLRAVLAFQGYHDNIVKSTC